MKERRKDAGRGERGGGLVEFCFTMPILLLIAGATIDLSRYMRFLQLTTFVSQETAGQIYRQCSDITIYDPPQLRSSGLSVNTALTQAAIQTCIQRIQMGAQQLLNTSIGRAAVSSAVFRWNITDPSPDANCQVTSTFGSVTVISARAHLKVSSCEGTDDNPNSDPGLVNNPDDRYSSSISCPFYLPSGTNKNSGTLPSGLTVPGIALGVDGIYQTKNGSSQSPRRLVSAAGLCQRGRVATVEVSYAFEPVVKFLPHMMVKLDQNGSQRETTVL